MTDQFIKLFKEGKSIAEVSRILGLSYNATRNRRSLLKRAGYNVPSLKGYEFKEPVDNRYKRQFSYLEEERRGSGYF